jgi:hypothetical protein
MKFFVSYICYNSRLESILMIMIISFDRLFLLILGPHYTMKVTMIKAYVQIGISWIIAFLLYGLAIIGWDIWTGERMCYIQNEVFCLVYMLQ